MRTSLRVVLCLTGFLSGPVGAAATFQIPDAALPEPLILVAYGDMRFTETSETAASSPRARRALVAKIATENPAAIFINGDLPYHGVAADYQVFRAETRVWRDEHLRVYPALGNHELSACFIASCLERWWHTFPELQGRRWYSVAVGSRLLGIALDSDAPLVPGSAQRMWLEDQITALDPAVRVVLIVMHHPPLADVQTVKLVDHNPRPNEQALAAYLKTAAAHSAARFVISAGHIHNYERLSQDGVTYLVSGGGGATPYDIDRTAADLYQDTDFPNYHYVRFELRGAIFSGQMIRLQDYAAGRPSRWLLKDRFEISLRP
ncbi:MAG TPA: metallophosphoesterase [Steroidobacteraceae bacterium]|nr:metallophosphoesterase [Steroidobacteraceae bacterium]